MKQIALDIGLGAPPSLANFFAALRAYVTQP